MIIPDINLLIYAYNSGTPQHASAKAWWEGLMNAGLAVAVPWLVSSGFIRLVTHPAVLVEPIEPGAAIDIIETWYARPNVQVLHPGPRHLTILRDLFAAAGAAGNLTTDAELAAIAIEHQCELHSNDGDFGRFPGLRWHNPLAALAKP